MEIEGLVVLDAKMAVFWNITMYRLIGASVSEKYAASILRAVTLGWVLLCCVIS
jgi:hypothetical protein